WVYNGSHSESGWTKMATNAAVQRVFNWAVSMRIIRENPFRGLTFVQEERKHGRDMRPEEWRALLRASDPYFRRLLVALKMTGARPGELSALQWPHIDWQRGIA